LPVTRAVNHLVHLIITIARGTGIVQRLPMAGGTPLARINADKVALRLRLLRAAIFAENCTQFAKRIGISVQRLNNFENGYPLSLEVASRIRAAAPGMSLDWLYHGDERALPVGMLDKLRARSGS
jgi:Helix-turn-helix